MNATLTDPQYYLHTKFLFFKLGIVVCIWCVSAGVNKGLSRVPAEALNDLLGVGRTPGATQWPIQ